MDKVRREQADGVRPELMRRVRGCLGQARGYLGGRCTVGVGALREDADASVLRERARCLASIKVLTQPLHCACVVHVACIKQGDKHVDVKQCNH